MINKAEPQTIRSSIKQRKKTLLFSALAVVLSLPLLSIASIIVHLATYREDIGWKRIYVESSKQVKPLSVGPRDFNLHIGTYEQRQEDPEYDDVDIEITHNDQRVLLLSYAYYSFPFSERSPGIYKLKDVDGDRLKDLVIRMDSGSPNYKFYYISSQDGKAYQTDQNFQSSQRWVEGKSD